MRKRSNMLWFLSGAALVLMALLVAVPLAATAIAPEATPTRTPRPSMLGPSYPTPARTVTIPAALRTPPALPADDRARLATAVRRVRTAIADKQATAHAGRTPVPPEPTRTPGPCEAPLAASAAWKAYTSPDGAVTLDIPGNWGVHERPDGSGFSVLNRPPGCERHEAPVASNEFTLAVRAEGRLLKEGSVEATVGGPGTWPGEGMPGVLIVQERVSVDGIPAIRRSTSVPAAYSDGPYTTVALFFKSRGSLYRASYIKNAEAFTSVFERMVSSLKVMS